MSDVKQLPFVFPYEEHSWRFVRSARAYLLQRLKQRDGTYRELNQSLVEYFQAARRRVTNGHESEARELDWRIAYHLAPQDAESSVRQLEQLLVDATVAEGGLADMKAVVDLCEEQKAWLERHEVEVAFFTGQYAYALGDYRKAEACFGVVWEKGHPSRIKAIAGPAHPSLSPCNCSAQLAGMSVIAPIHNPFGTTAMPSVTIMRVDNSMK